MKNITRLGVCTLNQWAMDFQVNLEHILLSIEICKKKQCLYRVGPELEICGYMCEDHFLENDTVTHCWEALAVILQHTNGIVCDVGMPVLHKNVIYNCRVICLDGKIHLIRPKAILADDGNYRESRWFTPWQKQIEEFELPTFIQEITKQVHVPIGIAIIKTMDTELGMEICEELWVPQPLSSAQALDGAEIIVNSSGSHFQMGKTIQRTDLFKDITKRNGACYLFCNVRGCDGNRLYFDGASMITLNGRIFATSEVFSLHDVEVTTCDIDLEEIRSQRINSKGRSLQAARQKDFPRIKLNINLTQQSKYVLYHDLQISYENEAQEATSCYLWDYLRRSGANGFMLALSGGLDSCATALCVFHMCNKVYKTIIGQDEYGTNERVLRELRRIIQDETFMPDSPQSIVGRLFYTAYLATTNSTNDTRGRSGQLAKELGSVHYDVDIDSICQSFKTAIKPVFEREPKFQAHGGTNSEDIALQNIQARTRMVMTYLLAQLTPWNNNKQGFLIVLGSSNLDESLRGYLTKYDCSSADINPIGSMTKNDLRKLLISTLQAFNFQSIELILNAKASAELRPNEVQKQVSEDEMGLTFDELEQIGKLRKVQKLGPYSMFRKLINLWQDIPATDVAVKVKRFFTYYGINRHKMVTLTPSFHAEGHSTDDNRFDFRQFLYNWRWPWQYKRIDELLKEQQM